MMHWILAILLFGATGLAAAAETVATVSHLTGTLTVSRLDGTRRLLCTRSSLEQGDTLTTAQDTYARIRFSDGAEIVLRPNTVFKIDQYEYAVEDQQQDNFMVSLIKGGMRAVTGIIGRRSKTQTAYHTPQATIGIRGTHFGALLCQADCADIPTVSGKPLVDGLHLDVVEGAIAATNAAGELVVHVGQFAYVKDANSEPRLVPADEGVQVTMPTSISHNHSDGHTLDQNKTDDQCTLK